MIENNFYLQLKDLHSWHYDRCKDFKSIVDFFNWNSLMISKPEEIFLHANIFKIKKITSTNINQNEDILMQSSGTSGSRRSNIYSDRLTRINQQRALIKIVSENLKINVKDKLNYYVIAEEFSQKERIFDAQKAAILGFSVFSNKKIFLLDKNGHICEEKIKTMINDHNPFIIFGFTSNVYLKLLLYLKEKNIIIDCKNSFLIHGGGWKKLSRFGVENSILKKEVNKYLTNITCRNYYGMIEQTGSIFMECPKGYLHSNDYGQIIIRDNNLEKQKDGREGIIQSISLLPKSYPGHSLITEDLGVCMGEDCCECGAKGKFFKVKGRLKKSEIRGCSDVY